MEEAAFLAAVQGIVRRVHVQHDALRLLPVPVQEQVHQQGIQPRGVRHDLLVAFPGVQRRPRPTANGTEIAQTEFGFLRRPPVY